MTDINTHYTHILQPDYYSDFKCLASACPDTCCKGWVIDIDPPTYEKWKKNSGQPASIKNKSANSLMDYVQIIPLRNEETRYQIRMNEKMECPMLTKDGLCSLVLSYGHPMTTQICQDYPRQINESENILQRAVSVRCSAVLELLWKKDYFQYKILQQQASESSVTFPAKTLLDGFLAFGNHISVSSASYLFLLFDSLYRMHRKLESSIPCDDSGIRDYGMEMITPENIQEVLTDLTVSRQSFHTENIIHSCNASLYQNSFEEIFYSCHNMMYDTMQNFFDSPVFGPDFHELFHQSKKLIDNLTPQIMEQYLSGNYLSLEIDLKMKLLIMEELFTSVLSTEVLDYESVLVRLQWLIMQYLVIRHILFLDTCHENILNDAQLMYRITRIFRVSDLPDIVKICFFDSEFKNWLWTPEQVQQLLII